MKSALIHLPLGPMNWTGKCQLETETCKMVGQMQHYLLAGWNTKFPRLQPRRATDYRVPERAVIHE